MKKCDRWHKNKRCQNMGIISSLVWIPEQKEEIRVHQCEDHMDAPLKDLEKWALARWERIHMDNKKPISPQNLV